MKKIAVSCSRIAHVIVLGAALATGSIFAAEVNWIGGSGGTEDAPLELYKASNWSNNALPSNANRYSLSVDSPTVLTNSAGIATKIADWMRFASGDFTVLGDMQIAVLGWSQPAGTATVVKKGDWLVTHEFVMGYNSGSYFALTNYCGSMTRSNAGSPFAIGYAGNTTAIVENLAGDWNITADNFYVGNGANSHGELHFNSGNLTVSGTVLLGNGSGAHGELRSQSGNHTFNKGLTIASGGNSTGIVEKNGGDWMMKGSSFYLATGSGASGEFYHRGGSFLIDNYGNVGNHASVAKAYFEISGGVVTNTYGYLQVGNNGPGTLAVKSGGRFVRIGEGDGASLWLSMRVGPGTLNVEGGDVLLGGALGCHYYGNGNGTSAVNLTDGGVLTCSRIWQRTGSYAVNVLMDNGTLRAYTDRTDFLPDASYLTVKVGNGGATFDAADHSITIAKEIIDADGESGPVTFAGDGGTIRLTGALNTTGAINLNEKTHLIAKDASMKSAILSRGITVLKPRRGSAKGTFTLFSVADGTQCTTADLASVTLGPGLTGATLSIVDGAITIEVSHSTQTWSGPAGTSALWSGLNWDDGEAFDDGNDALFATANAIAEVDADADALTLTFNANATLTGSGTLTVPSVDVASGVSATISAPTAGPLEKTGAGTLTLGASRSSQTTVSEGTLAMTGGATLNASALAFGSDPAKPITIDYGGGTLAITPINLIGNGCEATFRNGTFGSGSFAIAGGKTLRLGPGAKMTISTFSTIGNGGVGYFEIDGAEVTNTATYIQIGYNNTGTMTIKNGGRFTRVGEQDGASLWMSMNDNGSGTLNVQGGEMFLGGALGIHYRGSHGNTAINVTDGGVLTMSRMYQRSGSTAVNVLIDGGTLRAYENNTAYIPNQSYITVTVGAGGGTIDANGKNITVAKQLSGTGGVLYKGGGVVTLSAAPAYSGKTIVDVGTCLVVPSAVAGANLAFTIPAGLAPGVYEVSIISGNGTFAADVLSSATLPSDPDVRFILSGDGKRIYCAYGSGINEQVWIGGASGNLNVAANWLSGSVPTSGEAIIGSVLPATLNNPSGSAFAATSITFPANTALVTISGEGTLSGLVSIANASTQHHVFACPVNMSAGTPTLPLAESNYLVFSGGISLSSMPSVENMRLAGIWNLAGDWNTPPSGTLIKPGSTVDVSGTLVNSYHVVISANATLRAANVTAGQGASDKNRFLYENDGTFIVTGEMKDVILSSGNGTFSLAGFFANGNSAAVTRANGLVHSGSTKSNHPFRLNNSANSATNTIVLGSGGLSFSGNQSSNSSCFPYFQIDSGKYAVLASSADWAIAANPVSGRNLSLELEGGVTIDTSDYEVSSVAHTIRVLGRVGNSGVMTVKGCGRLQFEHYSDLGGLHVQDTATVACNAGCSLTRSPVNLSAGATFEVAQSGTATLGGALTLADGATLAFNFTERRTAPVLSGTSVTISGNTVNVKFSASDGIQMNGGVYTLTSGLDFSGKTLNLVDRPKWVKSAAIDGSGNIVLTAHNRGLMIYVK